MITDTSKPTTLDLATLTLLNGSHAERERGVCLMEAVAWFANEPHSDAPKCSDPVLTRVGIALNDRWSADERQKLIPLIPLLVGTKGSVALSGRRAWFILDRIIRWHYPMFLRELPNKPRVDLAERFEALSPIVDRESAGRARDLARTVRTELEGSYSSSKISAYAYADAADAAYAAAYAAAAAYAYAAAAAYAAAYAAAAAYADAAAADADAAYAAYAAAAADADAAYAAADAYAYADAKPLRAASVDRMVHILTEACAITEAS